MTRPALRSDRSLCKRTHRRGSTWQKRNHLFQRSPRRLDFSPALREVLSKSITARQQLLCRRGASKGESFLMFPIQLLHFTGYFLSPLTPFLVITPGPCSCISMPTPKYFSTCYIDLSRAENHMVSVKSSATHTPF